jgi:2-hydroxy-3-oxopropionate reductase
MTTRVGLLGLGNMGRPMAANLARAGFEVVGWDIRPVEMPAVAGAPVATFTPEVSDVGRACSVVICMLPELWMPRGVLRETPDGRPGILADGHVVTHLLVMSTCSPGQVAELAEELAHHGVAVVDAPVSGGVSGAERGELSIMVGADTDAYELVLPVLRAVGRTIECLGPVGAGSITKAANQLVVAATLSALAEAALLAESNGLDRAQVLGVLSGGLAASEVLTQKMHALTMNDFHPTGPAKFSSRTSASPRTRPVGCHCPSWRWCVSSSSTSPQTGWGTRTTQWSWSCSDAETGRLP